MQESHAHSAGEHGVFFPFFLSVSFFTHSNMSFVEAGKVGGTKDLIS